MRVVPEIFQSMLSLKQHNLFPCKVFLLIRIISATALLRPHFLYSKCFQDFQYSLPYTGKQSSPPHINSYIQQRLFFVSRRPVFMSPACCDNIQADWPNVVHPTSMSANKITFKIWNFAVWNSAKYDIQHAKNVFRQIRCTWNLCSWHPSLNI